MAKVVFEAGNNKKRDGNLSVLSRLVDILSLLSQGEKPTVKELAERYEVTPRTIQMDINKKLQAFPIYKDENHRYQFSYGYSLNKTMLDNDEMILLQLSLSQLKDVHDFDKTISTLYKKLIHTSFYNPYYIKQEDIEDLDMDSHIVQSLEKAIEYKNCIELQCAQKNTMVHPYKITNFDGIWYLFCKDLNDGKLKTYMINKLKDVKILNKKFNMSDHQIFQILKNVNSAWFEDGEAFEVKVKVYPQIADYFKQREFLQSQIIQNQLEDGSLIVTFEVSHDEDIDNIIKSWLPHIEVLEPLRLRNKIKDELTNYLNSLL